MNTSNINNAYITSELSEKNLSTNKDTCVGLLYTCVVCTATTQVIHHCWPLLNLLLFWPLLADKVRSCGYKKCAMVAYA